LGGVESGYNRGGPVEWVGGLAGASTCANLSNPARDFADVKAVRDGKDWRLDELNTFGARSWAHVIRYMNE